MTLYEGLMSLWPIDSTPTPRIAISTLGITLHFVSPLGSRALRVVSQKRLLEKP